MSRHAWAVTTATDTARRTALPLQRVGAAFMIAPEMKVEAAALGMARGPLYFRGRVGVLGDVTAEAAYGLLSIFPEYAVLGTWGSTSGLTPAAAVERYRAANVAWAHNHLTGGPDLAEATTAMLAVVDAAWTGPLALADGWKRQPRPTHPVEAAAHAATVLRELRGGLHFAALALHGVPVPMAVLADPNGGVPRMLRTGWQQEQVDELVAAATPEHQERWRAAEDDTDRAFGAALTTALGADGATRLADQLDALSAHAHPGL